MLYKLKKPIPSYNHSKVMIAQKEIGKLDTSQIMFLL